MKKSNEVAVVIPSYNEVKNISILIKSIKQELKLVTIIIVDDSSPSENQKLKRLLKGKKDVILISRLSKKGRGSAVIDGFKEALKDKNVKYVFEMDSDLAHDPREFKRFIDKRNSGDYDLVIGSRYVPGGAMINIPTNRTIMSRVINKFLCYWLRIHLTDHTGGFRFYKRNSVEYLVNTNLKSKGFITLSETAYRLYRAGFKIAEVPVTVNLRRYGKSTVNTKELIDSLSFVIRMRLIDLFTNKFWLKLFAVLVIFTLAFSVRVNSLNQMGRTWDEEFSLREGYIMDNFIKKGDFLDNYFIQQYNHFPLLKYVYGVTANLDLKSVDKGAPVFNYDFTYSRLLSAVVGSLSAVLVLLIGWEYVSSFVGLTAGIIFATLPFFIGFSQLASIESFIMFFFTAAVYSFMRLLKKYSLKKVILTGVLVGLALQVKQSNLLLFPTFGFIYLAWYFNEKHKESSKFINKELMSIIYIFLVSLVVFILVYPPILFHLSEVLAIQRTTYAVTTPTPEVFWGRLILSPIIYFPTLFFITTPVMVIILSLLGLLAINKTKSWILYSFIIWFCAPFLHSFYPFRYHGVRFIIEIYVPLSILAAMGVDYVIKKLKYGKKAQITSLTLILLYMFSILYQMRPYYLDYFNELVGGPKGVYDKRYFELGWWGEGLREAGYYLKDKAKPGSSVGLFISPPHVFPPISSLKLVSIDPNKGVYKPSVKYDYVIVNYYRVLREGFDDSGIKRDYKLIYQVKADGAPLVDVYSKK